jgi:periplasmic divalent cation tolerance protein
MKGLLVLCNAPDQETAEMLASRLVEERLAACVNILAPCRSYYHWEGRLDSATEIPLLIKTTVEAYPRLEQAVVQLHPYEVPEIIACEIHRGLPAYLTWVEQSVFSSEQGGE